MMHVEMAAMVISRVNNGSSMERLRKVAYITASVRENLEQRLRCMYDAWRGREECRE